MENRSKSITAMPKGKSQVSNAQKPTDAYI